MKNIEVLRDKLQEAIDNGSKSKILSVSQRLDEEIVKMIKKIKEFRLLFIQERKNENYEF